MKNVFLNNQTRLNNSFREILTICPVLPRIAHLTSHIYLTLCFALVTGCVRTLPTSQKKPNIPSEYEEDLSAIRPRYETRVERKSNTTKTDNRYSEMPLNVNRQVDVALDSIAVRNQAVKYAQGFRIQIYVGNSRQDVDNTKVQAYQNFPELSPYMSFSQPTYKLKVGDFMTRIDAERYLSQMRAQFPTAIILPEKIEIRKSIYVK